MDLETLGLLRDVARLGSFAAASRDRGLDASAVSRVIAGLEAELGARLFQRSTRRMALTEAGDRFLARVEPLIEEMERAKAEIGRISAGPEGTLRLTASIAFGLKRIVPLLPRFRALYPGLTLECQFTDGNLDLIAERIDLAIRLAPNVEGDLIATRLMPTRYRVVASPAYLRDAPPLARPPDLSAHRCLLFTLRAYRTRWLFRDEAGAVTEAPIDGDLTISTPLGLRDAAIAGLGPALLSDWLVDESIAAGDLVDVFPRHAATATTFDTSAWLIYPSRAFLPNKVRVMIDFLKSNVAKER